MLVELPAQVLTGTLSCVISPTHFGGLLIPPDADPLEVVPEFVPELELFPLPVALDA